ncbi:rho GTPase-activating protein 23 isoform X3 [Lepisosteus oculatus]|uniref:rho GTPase-activating protein 23 isoform X3 n=1 Tax=Lepisosteus oculatus TaxID=7918 RepID=UPI00371D3AA8
MPQEGGFKDGSLPAYSSEPGARWLPCPRQRLSTATDILTEAKGRRDGISSPNENAQPKSGEGPAWQGPRTVVLHKNSQGFGFTLRHFIVYPPESALHTSLKDEENGNGKGYQRSRLEPMDTIFVKNVREKGPAQQAGLCTGDRLVKVNGESILGKTYSQVIALIQNSESVLELSIMPKDEDVLQLVSAYSQDAYLRGNEPYTGGAQNLPDPPPICYPRKTYQNPGAQPPMGQNQLDNWTSRSGSSGPSSPLDNRSGVTSPAGSLSVALGWQEGRGADPGGVGHSSPAHRTEEIQYGMTGSHGRGRSVSSTSSSGAAVTSHYGNHHPAGAGPQQQQQLPPASRKAGQAWGANEPRGVAAPPQPAGLSKSERCQQALTDWYYSQVPAAERSARAMPPRHRSFSQDRLGEAGLTLAHYRPGWPHSASQDTLLMQPAGPAAPGDAYWGAPCGQPSGRTRSENLLAARHDRYGHSLEMLDRAAALVSPRFERPAWLLQAPTRTDGFQRPGNHYGVTPAPPAGGRQQHPQRPAQQQQPPLPPPASQQQHAQPAAQPRRLPPQNADDQPVGYRSYSPSFYRKTGRLMHAHSFRDPSYTGPHFTWTPPLKSSPPDGSAPASTPPLPAQTPEEPQDAARRLTNHERLAEEVAVGREAPRDTQEVVLRQKPPTGRRTSHALRHPHYTLPVDSQDPPCLAPEPQDGAAPPAGGAAVPFSTRQANGSLAPLLIEDDSLASIPFIDEPTSPSADLRARHVPASSVVSSAMSSAPAITTSPASPTFTFPLTRLFSHDCSSIKASRRSSYLLAITTERSKSCDEGLNTFREEGRVFSRLPKRVKSFFTDGSLESLGAAEDTRSKRHSTSELSNLTFSDVRKEGWLHYKQILTEKGKKVGSGMRPWKRVYSVMRSHSLFLYKDKREAVLLQAGPCEDEQPISIRGCLVDIAYSETKRKHALRLTTQDFCEYLLQAEDREDMLSWIKAIRENGKTDSEESGFSGHALISKKLNEYRKHSPTGGKPDSSPRAARIKPPFLLTKMDNATGAPRSPKTDSSGKDESSPPKSPWGINIMKKPKKSGPKAFGVRLEDCQPAISNKFIPLIVEICCGLVEEMGLEYTGIYRVPGNNAVVSSLQDQLNKGIDINPSDEKWQDLNVISSLLKSFFRKLPEPLFTDDKYNDFIDANRMEDAGERLKTMKKLIHDLPAHYYHTLKFLVGHLKTVADHSEKNKMEPRNLALVFGPTLVRTSEDNMTDMVTHMPDRYKIVETLIQHHSWFFNEETDKDDKTPVDKEDLQPIPNIDHLLSNIGRTVLPGEASDSTNSDSAKSKGSWGSKRDLHAKDFLTLSIMMSAVTRKRKKRRDARLLGSSTDEDSEHEPVKASNRGGRRPPQGEEEEEEAGDAEPLGDGEEEEEEEKDEEEEKQVAAGQPQGQEQGAQEGAAAAAAAAKPRPWRAPEDSRSIVSGYSTLSTLGRSLASEGRGDEADDERSELVSETDNESGFASRSLTQERPEKPPPAPRSFLYSHYKPPPAPRQSPLAGEEPPEPGDRIEGARSTTPSSFSSSSTAQRLHSRPSFNSHKLIQCDTLARKKLKGDKAKARSLDLDLELELGPASQEEGRPGVSGAPVHSRAKEPPGPPQTAGPEGGRGSLAEQVRARLLSSADDMFGVGMRKPHSPETRRKKSAWRRHTVVVHLSGGAAEPRPPEEGGGRAGSGGQRLSLASAPPKSEDQGVLRSSDQTGAAKPGARGAPPAPDPTPPPCPAQPHAHAAPSRIRQYL